jgi:hypothetical protein
MATRLTYLARQWILTVVSELSFVQDSTLALVCNVCNPYATNIDAFRLESLMQFVPQRLVKFLLNVSMIFLGDKLHGCSRPLESH